jgi:hypothetical protein
MPNQNRTAFDLAGVAFDLAGTLLEAASPERTLNLAT